MCRAAIASGIGADKSSAFVRAIPAGMAFPLLAGPAINLALEPVADVRVKSVECPLWVRSRHSARHVSASCHEDYRPVALSTVTNC